MKTSMAVLTLFVATAWPLAAFARLGETETLSRLRYGAPSDDRTLEDSAPLSSATYRTYTYQGWRITAAFIDGKTVRILYAKGLKSGADTVPTAEEIAAVLTAEAGEGEWKEQARVTINPVKSFSNLFLKTKQWVHSRGPLACLRNGGKVLVIEIPNVQALKATSPAGKDAGRGNIPKF